MEGRSDRVRELDDRRRVAASTCSAARSCRPRARTPPRSPSTSRTWCARCGALGVDHLITIGGDDTAFSARRVAEEAGGSLRVAHVPKTIDNDLPLPEGVPDLRLRDGARARDAHRRAPARGRAHDGPLVPRRDDGAHRGPPRARRREGRRRHARAHPRGLPGASRSASAKLVRLVEGAIVKRLAQRASRTAWSCSPRASPRSSTRRTSRRLADAPRDEHGHIRLAEVPLGRVLRDAVQKELAALGIKPTLVEKDVGYELRCAEPSAFDLDYTRDLGAGAVRALLAGASGVMITRQGGAIVPVPFEEIMDPKTGRPACGSSTPRPTAHASAQALQVRIEREDLEDAARLDALAKATKLTPEEVARATRRSSSAGSSPGVGGWSPLQVSRHRGARRVRARDALSWSVAVRPALSRLFAPRDISPSAPRCAARGVVAPAARVRVCPASADLPV